MAYSERIIQEILAKVDLVELVGSFVSLKQNGQRWWGLCPFHHEKSPSFTVNPELNFYYCFGCQAKGNAYSFLVQIEHLTFPEAVKRLAEKTGVVLDELDPNPVDKDRIALLELMKRLAGTFHHLLLNHAEAQIARDVLTHRGISKEIIETFQLGYVLADRFWLKNFLLSKSYSSDFLDRSGLFAPRNHDVFLFSGRLVFPIQSSTGEVVAFGGRILGEDNGPKYLNSSETSIYQKRRTLYALDKALPYIRDKQEVILCEGYMDAISLHQAGINWAVAPLGTAFTSEQAKFLKRYAHKVICLFDNDSAGQSAAVKAIVICTAEGIETQVVILTGGKDPAEVLETQGKEILQKMVSERKQGFDFFIDFHYNTFRRSSTFDWKGFYAQVFPVIRSVDSQVMQEELIQMLANKLKVSPVALKEDFYQGSITVALKKPIKVVQEKDAEWRLMVALAAHSDLFLKYGSKIGSDDFFDPRCQKIFDCLSSLGGSEYRVEDVFENLKNEPWAETLLQDVMSGEVDLESEKYVEEGVRKIKSSKLKNRRREVCELMDSLEISEEKKKLLMNEINFLDREIARYKRNI